MNQIWSTKLATWLQGPTEKSLCLLHDKTGKRWQILPNLAAEMGIESAELIQTAECYTSAADLPHFPWEKDGQSWAKWAQVDYAEKALLKHPLTGDDIRIDGLNVFGSDTMKNLTEEHFRGLIIPAENGKPDLKKTMLNYWRFGPVSPHPQLEQLWPNIPVDTRIPDHSLWAHLDLTSAFAGAMAADHENTPALLSVSFGPVQGFIAEARSVSDLWAGSHLLARITWEGLQIVCDQFGPDAVIFPNLLGVPLVDLWIHDQRATDKNTQDRLEKMDWFRKTSDANPLFVATLPNRFLAIVPADQIKNIAGMIQSKVREFVSEQGKTAVKTILDAVDENQHDLPCYEQLKEQLAGFPEMYWAAVPLSLTSSMDQGDNNELKHVISNFYPQDNNTGFLDDNLWGILQQGFTIDGETFIQPNPGMLYPVMYELLNRVATAAKSVRTFKQLTQNGFRSSLNGEREWLTTDRKQLLIPPGSRNNTLWSKLAEKRKSWVKQGEHLDALNTLKRMWPTLFAEQVKKKIGSNVQRYNVSTHTMALAVSLERWLNNPQDIPVKLRNLLDSVRKDQDRYTALPQRLIKTVDQCDHPDATLLCRYLPSAMDWLKEQENGEAAGMLPDVDAVIKKLLGAKPETYYAMLLMDGDRMGAWISGSEDHYQTTFESVWHPGPLQDKEFIRVKDENPSLKTYLNEKRPTSPFRHRAISEALNNFSVRIVRFVVEECFKGKIIYTGGDDLMAFLSVDDLLPAMTMLRYLYSGESVPIWITENLDDSILERFESRNGYLQLDDQLLLTMGKKAHTSCGAVVAHHQAPLGHVLQQLREAEGTAKTGGGRNAFSLRIIKRAGGSISLTDKWYHSQNGHTAPELLFRLLTILASPGVSRRAVYHSVNWLKDIPTKPDVELLKTNLWYQFVQQTTDKSLKLHTQKIAVELAEYVTQHPGKDSLKKLQRLLTVAEFLARGTHYNPRPLNTIKKEEGQT